MSDDDIKTRENADRLNAALAAQAERDLAARVREEVRKAAANDRRP